MRMPLITKMALASMALPLAACRDAAVSTPYDEAIVLESVSPEAWTALASRRVFFAHQSVGGNIAEGITALLTDHNALPLKLVRSSDPDSIAGGAIIHNYVGENGLPMTKTDGFVKIIQSTQAAPIDIALQKFCYADFDRHTDADTVFAQYAARIEALRAARPDVQIVHVTTPVMEQRFSFKDIARGILGRTTVRERMSRVWRFNEMLRARYGGVDPIFDLAAIESGGDSGTMPSLAARYATPDGAHLNALGERVAATRFLVFLATLPPRTMPS